jgi:hypothetical protein
MSKKTILLFLLSMMNASAFASPSIFWRNTSSGDNHVYRIENGQIAATHALPKVSDTAWQIAATGDFDANGVDDVLWRHSQSGANYLYLLNDQQQILSMTQFVSVSDTNWQVAGAGDFNRDGFTDILWRHAETGQNWVYLLQGSTLIGSQPLNVVADQSWQIKAVADFDNDGFSDVLWRNTVSGDLYIYFIQQSVIHSVKKLATVANNDWQIASVADFDGDGISDILWRNQATGANYMYWLDGATYQGTPLNTIADLNWMVAGSEDVNGDGSADLLWRHNQSGDNYFYLLNDRKIAKIQKLNTVADSNWKVAGMLDSRGVRSVFVNQFIVENKDPDAHPVTFGLAFPPGEIVNGLAINDSSGNPVQHQSDAKARHSDGSWRHAVITLVVPPGSSQYSYTAGSAHTKPDPLLPSAALNDISTSLSLSIDGQAYSATLDLQSNDFEQILFGDLLNEWRFALPVVDSQGSPHPHLQWYVGLRRYETTPATYRVEYVLENNWAYQPDPHNIDYDVDIQLNGESVASHSLTHLHHARWRDVVWHGGSGNTHVRHNLGALVKSGAIPALDPRTEISQDTIAGYANQWSQVDTGPMGIGTVEDYMPATGGRGDIGPLPSWTSHYLLTMAPEIWNTVAGNGRLGGSWSIHYRDKDTGLPVSLDDYPRMTLLGNHSDTYNPATDQFEAFPDCGPNGCSQPEQRSPDTAHQPSLAFVPYLLTGDYYYLEELQFWANWNMFRANPGYRQAGDGLVKSDQVRGQAWSLRTLAQAAFITPDAHPMKSYFEQKMANNIEWYNAQYVEAAHNPLGWISPLLSEDIDDDGSDEIVTSPWMDDFFTWAVDYVYQLGYQDIRPMQVWKSTFPVGRIIGEGYCWLRGAPYRLAVRDDNNENIQTFAEAYQASFDDAHLNCDPDLMAVELSQPVGAMTGYPTSPSAYVAVMQPALATAVNANANGASSAWQQYLSSTRRPDYAAGPQFSVLPRSEFWRVFVNPDAPDPVIPEEEPEDPGPITDLDSMPAGTWYEVPGSQLQELDGIAHLGSKPNVMGPWSGGVFDTTRNQLVVWGGGHADYAGNEIYAFNIDDLAWRQLTEPSPISGITETLSDGTPNQDALTDNTPSSRHTYNGLVYLPQQDKLWSYSGSIWQSGYCRGGLWEYDFGFVGSASPSQGWQLGERGPSPSCEDVAAYDSLTGLVYFFEGRSSSNSWRDALWTYDPSASGDPWQKRFYSDDVIRARKMTAVVDPERRLFVAIGGGKLTVLDISTDTPELLSITATGNTEIIDGGAPGVAYDPVHKDIVVWNAEFDGSISPTDLYRINTETFEISKIAPSSSNTTVPTFASHLPGQYTTGVFGRFRYVPSKDVYILVNGVDQNVYIYKR